MSKWHSHWEMPQGSLPFCHGRINAPPLCLVQAPVCCHGSYDPNVPSPLGCHLKLSLLPHCLQIITNLHDWSSSCELNFLCWVLVVGVWFVPLLGVWKWSAPLFFFFLGDKQRSHLTVENSETKFSCFNTSFFVSSTSNREFMGITLLFKIKK
jgi:hypothetical protein